MINRNPRDLWAGGLYLALGMALLWFGRGLAVGTSARMGPGYLPAVLGCLLVLLGGVSVVRSFVRSGEAIGAIAWKPMALVLGAIALFGMLLERAGLIIALIALIGVSALASRHTRLDATSVAAMIGIVAFCALVFVKGLGVPMPLIGTWLGG